MMVSFCFWKPKSGHGHPSQSTWRQMLGCLYGMSQHAIATWLFSGVTWVGNVKPGWVGDGIQANVGPRQVTVFVRLGRQHLKDGQQEADQPAATHSEQGLEFKQAKISRQGKFRHTKYGNAAIRCRWDEAKGKFFEIFYLDWLDLVRWHYEDVLRYVLDYMGEITRRHQGMLWFKEATFVFFKL